MNQGGGWSSAAIAICLFLVGQLIVLIGLVFRVGIWKQEVSAVIKDFYAHLERCEKRWEKQETENTALKERDRETERRMAERMKPLEDDRNFRMRLEEMSSSRRQERREQREEGR